MNNETAPNPAPATSYPGQPPIPASYPPAAPYPPKAPMDPAKKKRAILIVSLCSGLLLAGIAALIIVPLLLRVDYAGAYRTAKELKPLIHDFYISDTCDYVEDYVDSAYTSAKDYTRYVDSCKEIYSDDTIQLVDALGGTDAVRRDSEIGAAYAKFKADYDSAITDGVENFYAKLDLWQARHNFKVAEYGSSYCKTSDAEFTTAMNYLINSGNEAFKAYGEGLLERTLAVSAACRAADAAPLFSANYTALHNDYQTKRDELNNWIAANKPDINSIAPLNLPDTYKMYSDFSSLYNLISETYEDNYDHSSDDCYEFFGEVYCE